MDLTSTTSAPMSARRRVVSGPAYHPAEVEDADAGERPGSHEATAGAQACTTPASTSAATSSSPKPAVRNTSSECSPGGEPSPRM